MRSATSDDVAFSMCMICSSVWAASSSSAYGAIFSVVWLVFGILIFVLAKRDARRMREGNDGKPATSEPPVT